jgi:hypothetical protein
VTTHAFSKEYKLAVEASDVGVWAVLFQEGRDDTDLPNCNFFFKLWKQMSSLIVIFETIMMYMSSIYGVYWSQYRNIH